MKPDLAAGLVDGSTDDEQLSFRRAIQAMTPLVLAEKARGSNPDRSGLDSSWERR